MAIAEDEENDILRDWEDFDSKRNDIYSDIKTEMQQAFPLQYGGFRIEADEIDYADPDVYDHAAQKKALIENKTLGRRLRGRLKMIDEQTGEVIDEKSTTLMRVPFLTDRGTFIRNGTNYTLASQFRLLPGAYTRIQDNGEVENMFNVKPGSGPAFRVNLEPETGQYRLKVAGGNLHMYSLLKDVGVPEETLENLWGKELLEMNQQKYDARVFPKAYKAFVPKREQDPSFDKEQQVQQLKAALDKVLIHKASAQRTLPNLFDQKIRAEWQKTASDLDAQAFDPDPDVAAWEWAEYKIASTNFDDDTILRSELEDEYNNLYFGKGERLGGMKQWPTKWQDTHSTDFGWLDWYMQYKSGRRSAEDKRQINRWKRFQAREVPKFKKSPTAKKGWTLRMWAIDPVKLLPKAQRENFEKQMQQYKEQKIESSTKTK